MPGQGGTEVSVPLIPTRSDLYWRRIFKKYDKDNDGKISYHELKEIIESREYEHDLPDNVVDKIMSLADRDNSGYLDFNEFVEMMHKPDFKPVFGHLVASYVDSIVPHQGPVDSTGGTYEEEYSCRFPAICMILISLGEIVMFCYDYDAAHGRSTAKIFIYNPPDIYDVAPFIVYSIVHVVVVVHLVDLLVRLFLGVLFERVLLFFLVMSIYQMGVGAVALTTNAWVLIATLGAILALNTLLIATFIMDRAGMKFAKIQRRVFLCLAAVDVGTAVYVWYWGEGVSFLSYVAHGAGAIAGLLVGIGVFRNHEKWKWEKRLWWVVFTLYCLFMLGLILLAVLLIDILINWSGLVTGL